MRVIDLTHTITQDMPVYPGSGTPRLTPAGTYEKDGFKETLLQMSSHTGTHMDSPSHLFPNRTTLDEFPASQFIGKALLSIAVTCQKVLPSPWSSFVPMETSSPRQTFSSLIWAGTNTGARTPTLATTPA